MVPAMGLFPHQKLDWNLARLDQHLADEPANPRAQLERATALWSRARFHGGGAADHEAALAGATRVIDQQPTHATALSIAAASQVALTRLDAAHALLQRAVAAEPERAEVQYALAEWHRAGLAHGAVHADAPSAVQAADAARRAAPDAWEPHALLAALLWEQVQRSGGPSGAPRALQRSMYHAVCALERQPPGGQQAALALHLGIACLHTGRLSESNKLLSRLLEDDAHRAAAQYHLGLVNARMGKYKNAILYLRQHLEHGENAAKTHARLGMAYLALGEVAKARESCNRALLEDPADLQARWALGRAQAEEGSEDDALRTFKDILADAPGHTAAFAELVSLRSARGEDGWLQAALRAEVSVFDRLPVQRAGQGAPRRATRERILALIGALTEARGTDTVPTLLEVFDLTTDESLRFQLWEAALDATARERRERVAEDLADAGRIYSAAAGREVLALARALPEELLVAGLQIGEEDLRRAAVDRHGPARDVGAHREAIDHERREARAWQALLLLALGSHDTRTSRNLLVRWAAEADSDLSDAARGALAMLGDPGAASLLRKRARARGAQNLVDAMIAQVQAPAAHTPVRAAADGDDHTCVTCSRRSAEVALMLVGGDHALCDHCTAEIAGERAARLHASQDSVCRLSGRGAFETAEMYSLRGITVCREVVDLGLGLLEREAVARYLAGQ